MAKKAEATQEPIEQATEAPAPGAVPESISLTDLQLLLNIVDLASKRGAFQGNELSQVGAIFDKLNSFLSYVAEQQAAQAEAQAEAEGASTEGEEASEE